ncbi:MAG: DNA-directed RNA polymerase subunit N [Nitrososphaeria archaeon]|nr:DNA-directed RNA polymerase subunit N [Nitrososphaeria archaeon]NIN52086.1 DNA-directed RNA polymerase subunit N [Nitrososphaeria archaeon]NIQ32548.1 DNA-directed RNA polymerase subunit N [Nitrososphaeria archaeon]
MVIPIRCFSCGAVVGDKYYKYEEMVSAGEDPGGALDKLGVKRYCCRRMILSHVEIIDLFITGQGEKKTDRK